jgi:centrosomal CEP192-like protein/ASPM-SPD-2-Hydin domain-containing protein
MPRRLERAHTRLASEQCENKPTSLCASRLCCGVLLVAALTISITVWMSACSSSSVETPASNRSNGPLYVNPSSVNFGNVTVGSSGGQSFVLTNTGSAAVTISQATILSDSFRVVGPVLPISVAAAQSVTVQLQFAPQAMGSANANMSVVSSASNAGITVPLVGTGTQGEISAVPSSVSFGNVVTGGSNSQTIRLSNPGNASVAVTQASASGVGFSMSGLRVPITITPGASVTFNAVFAPNSTGAASGSVSLTSSFPGSSMSIPLAGNGTTATRVSSVTPASLSFGDVAVGNTSSQNVALANIGNSSVTVSQVTVSGLGYGVSGVAPNTTLASGQSAILAVSLTPTSTGSATGTVTITSNASNSPTTVTMSGGSHLVVLSWTASTSAVVGYNVYRGTTNSGSYPSKLNSSLISGTTFTDSNVQSSQNYYYVVTAVDSDGIESVYSDRAFASIPSP